MIDPKDRPSGPDYRDTEPGMPAIPPEVIERYRLDSAHPEATERDVRNALLSAALGPSERAICPTCCGLGEVAEDRLIELRAIMATELPPPPRLPSSSEKTNPER